MRLHLNGTRGTVRLLTVYEEVLFLLIVQLKENLSSSCVCIVLCLEDVRQLVWDYACASTLSDTYLEMSTENQGDVAHCREQQ